MILLMKPVCTKCGHVFDKLKIEKCVINDDKYYIIDSLFDFDPYVCPKCGEYIDSLRYPIPSNESFNFDADLYK